MIRVITRTLEYFISIW